MEYDVGSIVYLIDSKSKAIVPAQVNEQLTSKTVSGEKVSHNIALPNGKVVQLESINSTFFCSLDEVRAYLLNKATEIIDQGISSANKVVATYFGEQTQVEQSLEHVLAHPPSGMIEENEVSVTLDDGAVVKVKVPPEFLSEDINH
jgi:hypothetical protein